MHVVAKQSQPEALPVVQFQGPPCTPGVMATSSEMPLALVVAETTHQASMRGDELQR